MVVLFVNSGDPDQTPHSAASDLGLHCLPNTLLGVSRLQWVKYLLLWCQDWLNCTNLYNSEVDVSKTVCFVWLL